MLSFISKYGNMKTIFTKSAFKWGRVGIYSSKFFLNMPDSKKCCIHLIFNTFFINAISEYALL